MLNNGFKHSDNKNWITKNKVDPILGGRAPVESPGSATATAFEM